MAQTYYFKTNINCGGCVAKITPTLDQNDDILSWEVDTEDPSKMLKVETNTLTPEEIERVVAGAGFNAVNQRMSSWKKIFNRKR